MEPYYGSSASEDINNLGVSWARLSPSELIWDPSSKKGNAFSSWTLADQKIDKAINDGLNVLIPPLSTLKTPNNWSEYEKFLGEFVDRYKNRVKYFEVGNEMNGMWEPTVKGNYEEEIVEYLVRNYNVIKEHCPTCKVVFGALSSKPLDYYSGCANKRMCMQNLYPLIKAHPEFKGQAFDVLDFHWYGNKNNYQYLDKSGKEYTFSELVNDIKSDFVKYNINAELWMIEAGTYSDQPEDVSFSLAHQTEKEQAIDLVKRYAYPLSLGVKKIFWTTLTEFWNYAGIPNGYFDNIGLVNNPMNTRDGLSHKKLSYYTYKKMVEVLDGSDWNNVQTIQESDGVYIYKFTKNGKPIWVAWNDNSQSKAVSLDIGNIKSVQVTETVPKYESGKEVTDYGAAFNAESKTVQNRQITLTLNDVPVFVE
ncbi:MAG: hypothetical protein V1783_08715 [Bacteroidota bacterium]